MWKYWHTTAHNSKHLLLTLGQKYCIPIVSFIYLLSTGFSGGLALFPEYIHTRPNAYYTTHSTLTIIHILHLVFLIDAFMMSSIRPWLADNDITEFCMNRLFYSLVIYLRIMIHPIIHIKFIYSEKATKFCEIFTLLLTGTTYIEQK